MRKLGTSILGVVLVLGFFAGCKPGEKGQEGTSKQAQTVSKKVKLEFFVMSQCPYGVQVEDAIAPVLKKMGGDIDFTIDFIGGVQGDTLTSLHKENEVKGDMVQVCAMKYAPDGYFEMMSCMNKNSRNIPSNWEECAQQAKLPVDQIKSCYDDGKGKEGFDILKASFEKSQARKANGSPTIYLNGQAYRGDRSEKGFMRALCDAYDANDKPKTCADLPPPVKVAITIISDERCVKCRTSMLEQQMKSLFPGGETKILDYVKDEQAKKLMADMKLSKLPIVLFGKEVEQADNYQRIARILTPMGDYMVNSRWGRFDPTKEICDNKADDNNNGKIDCDDKADCEFALNCRKDTPNKLELFIMSQCPFGVRALDAMKEVLANFKNKVKFEVHFIASEEGEGFSSLHGQPEVDENIRELCAIKYYPKNYKFMDYVLCRNKNIRSEDWKSCATKEIGIDAATIEKCAAGDEGKKLLRDDIRIAEALDVSGSPTWYANSLNRFSGLDAETIKTNFCKYNNKDNKMKECETKLSGPPPQAQGNPPPGGACQ